MANGTSRSGKSGGGVTNPVFGKKGKGKSPEDAVVSVNSDRYSSGREYQTNCQRCVYAYEMQRRGYDVEALPATMTKNDPMYNGTWKHGFENQTWSRFGDLGTRATTVEKNIISNMQNWGDGSRAIVYVQWKAGSAHVFNVENKGGKVTAYDAQVGKKYDLSDYLTRSKPSKTMISRVDNLNPDSGVLKNAVKIKGSK